MRSTFFSLFAWQVKSLQALFAVAPSRKRDRRDVFEGVTVEGLEEDEMEEINQEMEDNDVLAKKVREKVRPRNGGTESMGAPKLKKKIAIAKTELRHEQNRPIPASSFLASSPAKIVLCSEPVSFSIYLTCASAVSGLLLHGAEVSQRHPCDVRAPAQSA